MKGKIPRYAGLISAVLAVVLVVAIYAMLGTVDLVFVNNDKETYRQENVSMFSDIDVVTDEAGEPVEYTFVSGNQVMPLNGNETDFRFTIAKTLLENLFTFKWQPMDQVIVLTAK